MQGDTRITERWDGGVLRRRSFERVSGRPSGEVVLDFAPAPAEGLAETRIQNGWCGYAATLVTLVESVPD